MLGDLPEGTIDNVGTGRELRVYAENKPDQYSEDEKVILREALRRFEKEKPKPSSPKKSRLQALLHR